MQRFLCATGFACCLAGSSAAELRVDVGAAVSELKQDAPAAQLIQTGTRVERVYGAVLATGATPAQSAERFISHRAELFAAVSEDLFPVLDADGAPAIQPVMYDAEADMYRFYLLTFEQQRDGHPVHNGQVKLLVRNEPDFPLVWAGSSARNLDEFSAPQLLTTTAPEIAIPGMDAYEPADTVIWAGTYEAPAEAKLALRFIATRGTNADPDHYKRMLYIVDAADGSLLEVEDQILHVDVTGNVSGRLTLNDMAQPCAGTAQVGLPYARVAIGATVAFADFNGNFVIPNPGSSAVTVNAQVRGQWFRVQNQGGSNANQNLSVTPPGPANFVFATSLAQFERAEVDAYYHANVVRDFALAANPAYPTIGTQTDWPINVNLSSTCNAFYDGGSINFYRAGGGCNNTAFADVVHHEYGHHLVNRAGSGQGAYGEGMSDVMGMILTGRSELGVGFQTCSSGIRNASNTIQFPCSGGIHHCGQLISGCVWDTWQALRASQGDAAAFTLVRDLSVNSMLLRTAGDNTITPTITADWLTLDDDDGDWSNGTPNSAEILAGFGAHNMVPQPPPANDDIANAIPVCSGDVVTGSTASATVDGSSNCASSSSSPDVWYRFTAETSGVLTASLCTNMLYDSAISMHSGMPGTTANQVACNDDFCAVALGGQVSASIPAGATFYIRVMGYNGAAGPFTLTITGPACVPEPDCTGDLDGDGEVGLSDLILLLGDFGNTGPNAPGDVDGDGDTDLEDLLLLLGAYGPCP